MAVKKYMVFWKTTKKGQNCLKLTPQNQNWLSQCWYIIYTLNFLKLYYSWNFKSKIHLFCEKATIDIFFLNLGTGALRKWREYKQRYDTTKSSVKHNLRILYFSCKPKKIPTCIAVHIKFYYLFLTHYEKSC